MFSAMLQKAWTKFKKAMSNMAVFCISTFIALLIGELIVRCIKPQQLIILNNNIWQPDSTFGWSTKPLVNTVINTGEKTVHFYTDPQGYRISSPYQEKGPIDSTFSVLTIGDSFLEAAQVENENTMNEQLTSLLETKTGKKPYFANTGVGGWGPNHYLLKARSELKRRHYDLGIVYIFSGNDIIGKLDTLLKPKSPKIDHKFGIPNIFAINSWKKKIFYPFNDYLERHSHLFILFRNAFQILLTKTGFSAVYFPKSFIKSDDNLAAYQVTGQTCLLIKNVFEHYKTPVLFVLLPHRIQLYPEVYDKYKQMFDLSKMEIDLSLPNTQLKELAALHGWKLLDPIEYLKVGSSKGVEYYGKVDFHLNEAGHKAIANFLAPYITPYVQTNISLTKGIH